ncbi:MAG: hypothetical protein FJ224_00280 [Lentisphaerae bacterium]|nr:hypothetical protein [Lentisphaerota bacterium]
MTRIGKGWLLAAAVAIMLSAVGAFRAQDIDENAAKVAEEVLIEEIVNGDLVESSVRREMASPSPVADADSLIVAATSSPSPAPAKAEDSVEFLAEAALGSAPVLPMEDEPVVLPEPLAPVAPIRSGAVVVASQMSEEEATGLAAEVDAEELLAKVDTQSVVSAGSGLPAPAAEEIVPVLALDDVEPVAPVEEEVTELVVDEPIEEPFVSMVPSEEVQEALVEEPLVLIEPVVGPTEPVMTAVSAGQGEGRPVVEKVDPVHEDLDADLLAIMGAEAAVKPAKKVPPTESAAPTAGDGNGVRVGVVEDQEVLRRRALAAHARELLKQADDDLANGRYEIGIVRYRNAIRGLSLPADVKIRKQAERGLAECYYRNSLYLEKQNDLNASLVAAKSSMDAGHPKGEAQFVKIKKLIDEPPPPKLAPPTERWNQQEYRDKQAKIADLMKRGREYSMAGEFDNAAQDFRGVLALDPQNTEAMRLLKKVEQVMYDRASMEAEATRQSMMREVREGWNPRDYKYAQESAAVMKPGDVTRQPRGETVRTRIMKKLEQITIPEIDFRLANINDVLEVLQDSSREFDKSETDEGKKGVNIILNLRSGATGGAAAPSLAPIGDLFSTTAPASTARGSAVPGSEAVPLITFNARYISLLEALKIVTNVANLKWRIEGSVVMIVPLNAPDGEVIVRMYDVLPSVEEKIPQMRAALGGGAGGSGFRSMEAAGMNIEGADWKEFFQEMGVKWPDGSSIKYVRAIGKVVVANTEDNLMRFEQVLSVLNVVPNQIEIEARFVEVSRADVSALGFEWLLTDNWEMASHPDDAALPPASRRRLVMNESNMTKGNRFLSKESVATAVADDIMTISSVLTNPELSFVLHALEQRGFADLLSAPKVTTQAGQEATIKVVTEYIYPTDFEVTPVTGTATATGATTIRGGVVEPSGFETREVGVILTVLPDVSPEGRMINLTMTPEVVSEPEWKDYGSIFTDDQGNETRLRMEQPFFYTRSIATSISIYNGATVVMGGMMNEVRRDTDDKVPFLGDIPIVGKLFRSKSERSDKRNLLIFVTAKLVTPDGRPVEKSGESLAGRIAEAGLVPDLGKSSETSAAPGMGGLTFP